jgi:putative membrane protein
MRQRWNRLPAVFVALALFNAPALAQQTQPSATPSYGPWYDGYGWQFWWICPLMMLLMFAVVAVFVFARRHGGESGHWTPPWRNSSDSAIEILSERFARGEIDRAEYEQKRAAILSRG